MKETGDSYGQAATYFAKRNHWDRLTDMQIRQCRAGINEVKAQTQKWKDYQEMLRRNKLD